MHDSEAAKGDSGVDTSQFSEKGRARVPSYCRCLNVLVERSAELLTIPSLLLLWELVSRSGMFNMRLFPPPSTVLRALMELAMAGDLWKDVLASCRRAVVGYVLGCSFGILLGTLTGRIRLANRVLSPLGHVLRAFPPVAIVPLAITWFGLAETSKYFLVFWGVLFPVWIGTHAGMSHVAQTYVWAARSLGAKRQHLFAEVLLPASLTHVLAGMRVAIGICFICVFVAEMAGAYEGIGFRISTSYLVFRVDRMLAALIVLGGMGAISDQLFHFTTTRVFPWTQFNK